MSECVCLSVYMYKCMYVQSLLSVCERCRADREAGREGERKWEGGGVEEGRESEKKRSRVQTTRYYHASMHTRQSFSHSHTAMHTCGHTFTSLISHQPPPLPTPPLRPTARHFDQYSSVPPLCHQHITHLRLAPIPPLSTFTPTTQLVHLRKPH